MFDVRFTNNGKDALESYQVWYPDIIVLDIWMPVMTGYLVLLTLRAKPLVLIMGSGQSLHHFKLSM